MKKSTLIMALALILSLALGVGGTLAYLTDRDSETNIFTLGNVDIDLTEDFTLGEQLIPGKKIEKLPSITNEGNTDAWVWATVAIPSVLDAENNASKNIVHFNYEADYVNDTMWAWQKDGAWMYEANVDLIEDDKPSILYNVYTVAYQTALKPGATTEPVMTQVYMDTHIDIDPKGDLYWVANGDAQPVGWNINEEGNPKIYVAAYAMQTEGFANIWDAMEAYGEQWGDNGGVKYEEINDIPAAPAAGTVRPAAVDPNTIEAVDGVVTVANVVVTDGSEDGDNLRALYTKKGNMVNSLVVTDCVLDGTYAMNVTADEASEVTLTAENTTFAGWTSYSGWKTATFTNCVFRANSNPEIYNVIRPYDDTLFVDCELTGTELMLDKLAGATVTFENCTYNGTLIDDVADIEAIVVAGDVSTVTVK